LFIPFGFGNGEFFADFDLGVVDGEADDVYLEPFGGEFEAFCFGFLALASSGGSWCVSGYAVVEGGGKQSRVGRIDGWRGGGGSFAGSNGG